MAVPKDPPYIRTLKFACINCGHVHDVKTHDGMQINIGTLINPYPGGGWWGKCRKCKKPGLRALEEPPKFKKGSVGWRQPR